MARRDPAATKARIVEAASGLFYARGIRAVGVDAIAAEAGVTKRTMYKHFDSKDALVTAYLAMRNEPVLAGLVAAATETEGEVADRIAAMFAGFADRASNPSWQGCPFARAASELRDDDAAEPARIAGTHKHTFEHWLQTQLAEAAVAEPETVARQLMVLLDGCITQILIHRDPAYATATAEAARCLIRARMGEGGA